ncbi:hypothetical protein ABK040_011706 [Willaertia magna]
MSKRMRLMVDTNFPPSSLLEVINYGSNNEITTPSPSCSISFPITNTATTTKETHHEKYLVCCIDPPKLTSLFLPSEIWRYIFSFADLYSIAVLMKVQKKWSKIYKDIGLETKAQFYRLAILELIQNHSSNDLINYFNISRKLQILKEYILMGYSLHDDDYIEQTPNKDTRLVIRRTRKKEQIFSVFNLINDIFQSPNVLPIPLKKHQLVRETKKIALIGDKGVSKTTFIKSYHLQRFATGNDLIIENNENFYWVNEKVELHDEESFGEEEGQSQLSEKKENFFPFQLWDANGEQKDLPLWFLKKAHLCILMFDVTKFENFLYIKKWFEQFSKISSFEVIIVATKTDLIGKEISNEVHQFNYTNYYKPFIDSYQLPYIEISCKLMRNVHTLIYYAISILYFINCKANNVNIIQMPKLKNGTNKMIVNEASFHR